MRTIADLAAGIPKEVNGNFPDGTIVNETPSQEGTPVVREIYGDILTNVYKIVREAGLVPNGIEDSEATEYQFFEALKKFTNSLNDIERQLISTGSVFSVDLDISALPNKYFFIARAQAVYVTGNTYTFKGNEASPVYSFSSTGFDVGDEVLVIIDSATVRAYKLSGSSGASANEVYTPFGTPLAYNNSSKVWYQSEGILFSDTPEVYDLQAAIRVLESDGTILVYEMFIIGGFVLCLSFKPAGAVYKFYRFTLSNLSTTPVLVPVSDPSITAGFDYKPYVFTDGVNMFITNHGGNNATDRDVSGYIVNLNTPSITGTSSITMNAAFQKSTNAAIKNNHLYTYTAGILRQFSLTDGNYVLGGSYPGNLGVLFILGTDIFYSSGDVGKKWNLPIFT
jgi:hypothetical protein